MPRKMRDSGVAWIGAIPEGWRVNYLFQVVSQVKERNEDLKETNLLSLSYGKIKRKSIETVGGLLPSSFDGYNIIENNDIVLRLTDLQNDQHSLRVGIARERGIITSAYITIRPSTAVNPDFLFHSLFAFDVMKGFYGMGAGVRQGLNYDEVKQIKILLPPLPVQCSIANHLNARCAEIDAAIASARQSIEDYKALKKSLVFETVTGKRNVGRVEVEKCRKMRDSGVAWIGAVPDGWRYIKSQHVLESVGDVDHYMPDTADEGVPYVMTGNLRPRSSLIDFASCKHIAREDYKAISKKTVTRRGDVIFARYATIGTVCLVDTDIDFAVSYSCVTIRPKLAQLDSRYLFHYMQSSAYAEEIKKYVNTNIQGNVGISSICQAKVMCPPLPEQRAIADYLDEKCGAIDALVAEKESLIADLEAYKKSLIFEVVTGKQEVA